jgi:hypothetical protein
MSRLPRKKIGVLLLECDQIHGRIEEGQSRIRGVWYMTNGCRQNRCILYSSERGFNSLYNRVINKMNALRHVKLIQLGIFAPDLSLWNDVNCGTASN